MELMKPLHVIPACPRTCLFLTLSWPSQHCHPPSCVNLPTASLSADKGINDICCQQGQLSPDVWHIQLLFVSCYQRCSSKILQQISSCVKDKGGRRVKLLPSCGLLVPKACPGAYIQSCDGLKSNTRPWIQPHSSPSLPEIGHFLHVSIKFHYPVRLHFPSILF